LRFQRRGVRKRIVAPDGSELVSPIGPADSAMVKAIAVLVDVHLARRHRPARFARPSWQGAAELARRARGLVPGIAFGQGARK
jgi:hypothetical protein